VLKVKLPRPVERQLTNGMKLLVVESHRVPTITLRMNMPSGDLRDPANLPGVSDATAALIRLGTKTRSAKDIADAVAELGASLSFGSSQGESTIFLSSMTENFDAALALLADVLMNPTFPQDELDKWKTRQRAQLEQAKSSPGFPANDLVMKLLYDDARRYTHPTVESLSKITRESVMEHYKTYYVPSGEWAGISGDISARDAVAKLDKVLGAWKGGPVAHVAMKFPEALSEKKVYLIPRPNSVQTLLMVANHAIDRKSPDYIECQVMNRVLGSGPSSRLFRIIREEKGYTYGIGSGFSATRYSIISRLRLPSALRSPNRRWRNCWRSSPTFATARSRPTNWPTPRARSWPVLYSGWRVLPRCFHVGWSSAWTACRRITGIPTRRR